MVDTKRADEFVDRIADSLKGIDKEVDLVTVNVSLPSAGIIRGADVEITFFRHDDDVKWRVDNDRLWGLRKMLCDQDDDLKYTRSLSRLHPTNKKTRKQPTNGRKKKAPFRRGK